MNTKICPFLESTNTDLLLDLIQKDNSGITFLPEYVVQKALENQTIKKIDVPDLEMVIWRQIFYHKDKWVSKEMKAFFEIAQNGISTP